MTRKHAKKFFMLLSYFLMMGTFNLRGSCYCNNVFLYNDGTNVTSCSVLDPLVSMTLWSAARIGAYEYWSTAWKFLGKYGTINFDAQTTNDITVGVTQVDPWDALTSGESLYRKLLSSAHMVEIVIGGWANNQSVIRKGSQAEPVKAVPLGIPRDQNNNTITTPLSYSIVFYYDAKKEKDTVAAYVLVDDKWKEIIKYRENSFDNGPRWVSLSSWDVNVFYTNINVVDHPVLPS